MVAPPATSALKSSIFCFYVSLWVVSHLLIYASRQAGATAFNATSVVLLTETVKLLLALGLYLRFDGDSTVLWRSVRATKPLLVRYAMPAVLYCIYNNLVYVNLASFDPGTYNVLMQLRIVLTGIIYQYAFSKRLNRNQWLAIVLIALGCMLKESPKLASSAAMQQNVTSWLLLLLQMLASVCAGVYTEVLLKSGIGDPASSAGGGEGVLVTTNLQNAYMYLNSMLANVLVLAWQGRLHEALSSENLAAVASPTVLAIVAIMSSVGLVTGFFLRHLDSVLKAVASALEVVFTMLASYVFFGIALDAAGIASALLVGCGVALYARPRSAPHSSYELVATSEFPRAKMSDEEDSRK